MKSEEISGKLLSKNWTANIVGQGLPLLLGLFTIPYLLRHLGAERFGILSIAWTLLGYLGQCDLGLGRATTKFVAECLGKGDIERLPRVVWTALVSQIMFGMVAAGLLGGFTPLLVNRILKISPAFVNETRTILIVLAASLPLIIATNCLRGVLEAAQQFAVINYIKIPASASIFLLPVIAVRFRAGLPTIVLLLVLTRALATLAYLGCCYKSFPVLRSRFAFELKTLRPLLVYGGWVSVSNFISPFLVYLDRMFIGSVVSMVAVGYYTAPYEMVTKIWLFPASLLSTLFPAFTALHFSGSHKRLGELYVRSLKSLLLVCGVALVVIAVFARQILNLWLGRDFSAAGASTLQILALGMLVNSIAYVPVGLLQGLGRPDLTAKFHLLELPFYCVGLWLLLRGLGLPGAAWAWTLRVLTDTLLLFLAVWKLKLVPTHMLADRALQKTVAVLGIFTLLQAILASFKTAVETEFMLAGSMLLGFALIVWKYVLDSKERSLVLAVTGRAREPFVRTR